MSTSYGSITITDTTDLGQLSVYLTSSTVRQQIYDGNTNPPSFYPNWEATGNALVITPHVYFNGASQSLSSNQIEVVWKKEEGGHTYGADPEHGDVFPVTPPTTTCPESAADQSSGYKKIQRPANLTVNGTGATYIATITYYPISGDRNVKLQAIATLDLTISNNGEDGAQGVPAKSLQLIGSGSHFLYNWQGVAIGSQTIDLSVEKSLTVEGVHWYCDGTLIETNNTPYTGLTLSLTPNNISTYSTSFTTKKSASFQIVEIDSNGQEITGGLKDYFTIYRLQEAQPGGSTYSSYLDNDQETVNEYNGTIDFTNAITVFYLDKGGSNDLVYNSGWTISISDSNNIVYTTGKSNFNTLPAGNNNTVTAVTSMTGNTAWIQFTAQNTNPNISDQIKRFTIIKNPSLVSHSLRLNSVVANRDTTAVPNGVYTPSQIVIDAIVRTGGGTDSYRVANAIEATIYYKDGTNSTTQYNSNGNALTITLADKAASGNIPASPISYIETSLKYNNNTVDSQKVVISCDGADGIDGINGTDGEDAWNFILGNEFDAISTDFTNRASAEFVVSIPIEAVQGVITKDIHYGGSTYPVISAPPILTSITPQYYLGNTQVTTTGGIVNNIKYTIPANTNIGATGTITLELTYAAGQTIHKTYTYKAQPEALKPIRVLLDPQPTDTFENQSGTITIEPIVRSGTDPVTASYWGTLPSGTYEWEAFNGTSWINATTINGITATNHILSVSGEAVEGYLGLRFNVVVSKGGVTDLYTEYINLKDIDDPLQVTLHSTIGEQIVNGQGVGVIYARVIRKGDNEDYDIVVPDNLLGIGTVTPTGSINTDDFAGKTGYCLVVTSGNPPIPTGEVKYYWRTATNASWQGPRGTSGNEYKYNYTWYFRDEDNEPYVANASNIPTALNYLLQINSNTHKPLHNQQFVYLDADVVNNKLNAVVKVEL